ncbi:MAG: fasciclin domain-containing protein, partial [Bacteroidales bacterium]|nr:fasciclin domain-containing protein [Bacteroidales bacterium]
LNAYNPSGNGFTLFLPSDDAFISYIQENDKYNTFEDLLNDRSFSGLLGRYHIVNKSIRTTEIPYGALSDSTATGDYLTISIEISEDTALYKVNNTATLIAHNIEVSNGHIHVLDNVLEPITYNSYEWLENREGYSILSGVLNLTGLKDTMGIYTTSASGQPVRNSYTVLAEHDSIFRNAGINNLDDLVNKYATPGLEPNDPENMLYHFAAYHLLEKSYFLDAFITRNYNTYAFSPVSINAEGLDIRINTGVDTFGLEIIGTDTTWIDYIGFNYLESNINTKNGPIHVINQVMELFQPRRTERFFQFLEDPVIWEKSQIDGTHEFVDPDQFEVIWWEGPESIKYVKSSSSPEGQPVSGDFLEIEGNFTIQYTMPKIMTGIYKVQLRIEARNSENATIQVSLDGTRIGSNFSLISGGTYNYPYYDFEIGTVELTEYSKHTIE